MGNINSDQVTSIINTKQINVRGAKHHPIECDDECNPKKPAPTPLYTSVVACTNISQIKNARLLNNHESLLQNNSDFENFYLDNKTTTSFVLNNSNELGSSRLNSSKRLFDIAKIMSIKKSEFKYSDCDCNTLDCDFCYLQSALDNLEIAKYSI